MKCIDYLLKFQTILNINETFPVSLVSSDKTSYFHKTCKLTKNIVTTSSKALRRP